MVVNKDLSCSSCDKPFKWYRGGYICDCRKSFCSKCLKEKPEVPWFDNVNFDILGINFAEGFLRSGLLCEKCWTKHMKPIDDRIKKQKKYAQTNHTSIEVFPSTYKGNIKKLYNSEEKRIKTKFFRDRQDAEEQLKFIASYHGFDLIYDRAYHKKTDSEFTGRSLKGTYYYSTWAAEGIACRKHNSTADKKFENALKESLKNRKESMPNINIPDDFNEI